ncbi:MAG: hypothetical protein FJ095_05180 [Deltaproteobacteria bacterium]|nr:hypothetical protein [Deltaproteobacteria bacterium]
MRGLTFARQAAALFALTLLSAPSLAVARGGLRASKLERPPELDGVPGEWSGEFRELTEALEGPRPKARDLSCKVALAHDERHLYVAAIVEDDVLVAGQDHVELLVGVPGGVLESLRLYPGEAGKSRAVVKTAAGRVVEGARIVEAPSPTGYTLEAAIPWARLPRSDRVRIGFRGAVRVHDGDGPGGRSVLGSSAAQSYDALPPLSTEAELSLGANLLRQKGLTMAPRVNFLANVVGDAMLERVLVYDRYLVVLGPTYRAGAEYFYRDLGSGVVVSVTASDTNGDRRDDLRVHRGTPSGEVVEIFAFEGTSDVPTLVSSQALGGGAPAPVTSAPSPEGPPPDPAGSPPRSVPRGDPSVSDTKNRVVVVTRDAGGADPDRVYALYRKRRGVDGPPRFDLSGDLAEDARAERLVVHGTDLVVFGPGFRDGRSFAALSLPGESGDLESVALRDVDADGKVDVVVVLRRDGRTVTATYRVRGGQLTPIE